MATALNSSNRLKILTAPDQAELAAVWRSWSVPTPATIPAKLVQLRVEGLCSSQAGLTLMSTVKTGITAVLPQTTMSLT